MNTEATILIVEDEVLIADYLMDMLQNEGFKTIEIAHNSVEALHFFKTFVPDIILLDINLDGQNSGINLAVQKNEKAKIIYITAQNDIETIQKAVATNPETYLTKPIKKPDLLAAIQLASYKTEKKYSIIKDGYTEVKLLHNDILYIKSENNYIDIITELKKYTLRSSLDHFLEELNNNIFCKVHRSFIVNKTKITKKTKLTVFLNDIEIPISRSYKINL
ncbi:LytR/AlgR family response regulator transcription factor [Flavobacterium sp.]|uniref:LytR/AlgR family response regulator transcription factor n=1 Tax=Flavobacterium sp. TaxID=239 RepID=UPI0035292FA7